MFLTSICYFYITKLSPKTSLAHHVAEPDGLLVVPPVGLLASSSFVTTIAIVVGLADPVVMVVAVVVESVDVSVVGVVVSIGLVVVVMASCNSFISVRNN